MTAGGGPPDIVVSTLAVEQVSRLVDDVAPSAGRRRALDTPFVLPPPPDCGFTVAMRRATSERPGAELGADDLVAGVRVDVAVDGGPPHRSGPVRRAWTGGGRPLRYGDHAALLRPGSRSRPATPIPGSEQVVSAVRYLRRSAVDPPSVVGTRARRGARVVVRSDDDGRPIGPHPEWTIVPPELDPLGAARHGVEAATDPAAAGLSFIGLPGRDAPLVIPFAGVGRRSAAAIARPAVGDEVTGDDVVVDHEVGSDVVELLVPPGVSARFELATPVAGSALQDLYVGDLPPATLLDGTAVSVAAAVPSRSSHVVQRSALERRAAGARASRRGAGVSTLLAAVRAVRVDDRPLGPGVVDAAIDDAAGLVYASHGLHRRIHVLRAHDLRPMALIGDADFVGPRGLAVDGELRRVYVARTHRAGPAVRRCAHRRPAPYHRPSQRSTAPCPSVTASSRGPWPSTPPAASSVVAGRGTACTAPVLVVFDRLTLDELGRALLPARPTALTVDDDGAVLVRSAATQHWVDGRALARPSPHGSRPPASPGLDAGSARCGPPPVRSAACGRPRRLP